MFAERGKYADVVAEAGIEAGWRGRSRRDGRILGPVKRG